MLCCGSLAFYLVIAGGLYGAYLYAQKWWMQRKLDKFDKSKCPNDKIILHGTKRTRTVPAASPFVLKLETFMRMAKIPYEYDGNPANTFGPKGKTPWISLNGEHTADSQICIEYLMKKFDMPFKNTYTEKEKAIAHLVRIMFEDRIFWELVLWSFIWPGDGPKAVQKVLQLPWYIVKLVGWHYNKLVYSQGLGRHSRDVIEAWILRDLRTVGTILGNNKFLLGDEPCLEDAAVFGYCAQLFWGFPAASPYAKIAKDEFPNVEAYCKRMKDLYFPDWDQLLAKPKSS